MSTIIKTVKGLTRKAPCLYLPEPSGEELDLAGQLPKSERVELLQCRNVVDIGLTPSLARAWWKTYVHKDLMVEMHVTVSSRQNSIKVYFCLISATEMIFGQPHAPTNDQIQRYIDHIYEQMAIACNVLMT